MTIDLVRMRRGLDKKINERKHAVMTVEKEKQALVVAGELYERTLEAQKHLQQLAQEVEAQAHKRIAEIVSKCLDAVFDGMYQLKIDFVQLRGKTEAKLIYLDRDGNEVNPLMTSGGVLDVSALALRVANLILSSPALRKLLVLDEPFTKVSATNMPKVCALIETLNRELGIQFLIVTHSELLQIGKVIQL